ncbi:hypothetical protein [Streptomyces sp. NPDC093610]|uniref:hypothetical protein n=1 Tax=Streptomyces sp. NPDC093610 TaxID=3366048 RepID=UPI00382CFF15
MLMRHAISQNSFGIFEGNFEYQTMASSNGVRFAPIKEAELDPALRRLASTLPRSKPGAIMMAEVPGPVGIPDLVALPGPGPALQRRLDSLIPPVLNPAGVEVISALHVNREISIATLKRRCGQSDRALSRTLHDLERKGAVISSGKLWRKSDAMIPVGNIYALEAKVDDWRKGVRQAFRYRAWCSSSALILSKMPRNPEPLLSVVQRLGIGLALDDQWLVRPPLFKIASKEMLWGSEHFVAALGFSPTRSPLL